MIAKYTLLIFFLVLFFLCSVETIDAQERQFNKAANIEFFGSTRGFFIAPSFSFSKKKHHPSIGILLGRHHTLNANGFGLNFGDRYYPNKRSNKLNLFFIGSLQLIAFTHLSSPSIQNIYNLQASGGYGCDYKISPKLSLFTHFSLGFLIEFRTFIPKIDIAKSLDSAGILSLGMAYTFTQQND